MSDKIECMPARVGDCFGNGYVFSVKDPEIKWIIPECHHLQPELGDTLQNISRGPWEGASVFRSASVASR